MKEKCVIGVAVNDDSTLKQNLAASPFVTTNKIDLFSVRGASSAALAYNRILDGTEAPYVVLCHQDVFLPEAFEFQLGSAIAYLNQHDPNWALLGVVGKDVDGQVVGQTWSNGLQVLVGHTVTNPCPVVSIDELLIVVRRSSRLRFDEDLPGFHLYGTDIVMDGLERGLKTYVIHAPVVHNSVSVVRLDSQYVQAYIFMQKKWSRQLPVQTLIVPITGTLWPVYRSQISSMKRCLTGRRPVVRRHPDPQVLAEHFMREEKV